MNEPIDARSWATGAPPHQWPPDVGNIGVQAAWVEEHRLEEGKRATAQALEARAGELRTGPIDWRWFDPELAGAVLDTLVEGEPDEDMFNYLRRLRGLLREHGGFLVIAFAEVTIP